MQTDETLDKIKYHKEHNVQSLIIRSLSSGHLKVPAVILTNSSKVSENAADINVNFFPDNITFTFVLHLKAPRATFGYCVDFFDLSFTSICRIINSTSCFKLRTFS